MMRARVSTALAILSYIVSGAVASADVLLQVNGGILKWKSQASGTTRVITYAVLTGRYAVPRNKSTLSPNNCGAMHAFANIIDTSPRVSEEAAMHELQSAFSAWEQAASIAFVKVNDAHDADIVVGAADDREGRAFANLSYRDDEGAKPVAKALGRSGPDLPKNSNETANHTVTEIDQAYICLNPAARWKIGFDGNLDVYDLRHTFTHEIGHAIGLDHPKRSGAVMAFRYDERVQRLQPSDVAAVQNLYGPSKREE